MQRRNRDPYLSTGQKPDHAATVTDSERRVLRQIWHRPGISRVDLASHFDLAQQSIHRLVETLSARGLIVVGPPVPGTGRGKPSPTLRLNGAHAYSAGISVNVNVIDICVMDQAGTILAERTVPRDRGMEESLTLIRSILDAMQCELGLDPERLCGIGLGIAGYHVSGTQMNAALPLHDWSLIELGPLMSARFGKPVWVHNGGNTAALAENMMGIGNHVRTFAYLSFNYGFGGGLIHDGELLTGGFGNAGEFGGMFDEADRPLRPALQLLIEHLAGYGVDIPSVTYLRDRFDPNWPGLREWVEKVQPAHIRMVNAIIAIINPQAVAYGGQIPPGLAQMLIDGVRIFSEARYGVAAPRPKFIISQLGGNASSRGAAIVPLKEGFY
ncbi:ROK family transcriptional regulator [Paracoccus sp. S1E-3]|uniref:ROK family transcriptional regulator n=1 Tax=Paracoccus sp. S1E-3 TaxID=2756130 RepID=UPI0015EEEB8E|nr:ROK family transcriptional regulator [Paracoccus sp. S1E-3]MBA4489367.1 ROK family transcriptional regulator [Paracoccus sp. S1E-3]